MSSINEEKNKIDQSGSVKPRRVSMKDSTFQGNNMTEEGLPVSDEMKNRKQGRRGSVNSRRGSIKASTFDELNPTSFKEQFYNSLVDSPLVEEEDEENDIANEEKTRKGGRRFSMMARSTIKESSNEENILANAEISNSGDEKKKKNRRTSMKPRRASIIGSIMSGKDISPTNEEKNKRGRRASLISRRGSVKESTFDELNPPPFKDRIISSLLVNESLMEEEDQDNVVVDGVTSTSDDEKTKKVRRGSMKPRRFSMKNSTIQENIANAGGLPVSDEMKNRKQGRRGSVNSRRGSIKESTFDELNPTPFKEQFYNSLVDSPVLEEGNEEKNMSGDDVSTSDDEKNRINKIFSVKASDELESSPLTEQLNDYYEDDDFLETQDEETDSEFEDDLEDDLEDFEFKSRFYPEEMRCLALVSHNHMKPAMKQFVRDNRNVLKKFRLTGTNTTMKVLNQLFHDDPEICYGPTCKSGPLGGDAELCALMCMEDLGGIIFFEDPMFAHPHVVDVDCLVRLTNVYDIFFATNPASAKGMISIFRLALRKGDRGMLSSFFKTEYSPSVEEYNRRQESILSRKLEEVKRKGKNSIRDETDLYMSSMISHTTALIKGCDEETGSKGLRQMSTSRSIVDHEDEDKALRTSSVKTSFSSKDLMKPRNPSVKSSRNSSIRSSVSSEGFTKIDEGQNYMDDELSSRRSEDKSDDDENKSNQDSSSKEDFYDDDIDKEFDENHFITNMNLERPFITPVNDKDFHSKFAAEEMRSLALIAHNHMIPEMLEFVRNNKNILRKFRLTGTKTTMAMLHELYGDDPTVRYGPSCQVGALGGDAQLCALLCNEQLGGIVFLVDPMDAHPHQSDISCLHRQCNVHDIYVANNPSSADSMMYVLRRSLKKGCSARINSFFETRASPGVLEYKKREKAEIEQEKRDKRIIKWSLCRRVDVV